jgi:hypothetical protein
MKEEIFNVIEKSLGAAGKINNSAKVPGTTRL